MWAMPFSARSASTEGAPPQPAAGPPPRASSGRICGEEAVGVLVLPRRELAHLLGDLHRAELGPAHRAEVRGLGAFRREGLVVVLLGGVGIEAEVELVAPAELEAGFRQRVVAHLG